MEDGPLLGEFTMRSFGEYPREENASLLSQILEDSPHPRFSLSAKACIGILNRAERRGKQLPPELKDALEAQSAFRSEPENLGGGKGILIQTERTGALSTLNNQSVFCLQGNGIDRAETAGCNGKGWCEDVSYTLNTIDRHAVMGFAYRAGAKAGSVAAEEEMGPTLLAGRNDAAVYDARGNGDGRIAPTIIGDHQNRVTDYTSILLDDQGGSQISVREDGKSCTLRAETHGNIPCVLEETVCCDVCFFNSYQECRARGYKDPHLINGPKRKVRRLTPLECERLQGYPDGWTDIGDWVDSKGKKHKAADSPRYRALGNSIALPYWKVLLKRISAQYDRDATMASLFDGIGGFPLIWERINGKGTCLWASEIEEFPMAVTKLRFGE